MLMKLANLYANVSVSGDMVFKKCDSKCILHIHPLSAVDVVKPLAF